MINQPARPGKLYTAGHITTFPEWGDLASVRWAAVLFLIAIDAACAPMPVLTGTARTPIDPAEVVIYSMAPPSFEPVAVISASSRSLLAAGGAGAIDRVVQRLKEHAAKLGANGLILDDFDDQESLSLGTGVGSDTYTHNGSISLGVGGFFGLFKKTGTGRAIYVPPRAGVADCL
jgi:hypothetical protein